MDTPGSVCFVDGHTLAWQTVRVRSAEPRKLMERIDRVFVHC